MSSVLSNEIREMLDYDVSGEVERIVGFIRDKLRGELNRRGLVVALSGGVDSSVCAALAVRAVGRQRVLGLLLPEQDSSSSSSRLAQQLAERLGIEHLTQNIGPALEAVGCYHWRDEAIRRLFPDYASDWKNKIVIRGAVNGAFSYFNLVVQSPDGELMEKRLPLKEYLQIVAATNYKQRMRKMVEYFHADRLNYAVVGTPNLLEYDQGFFVKNGDGSADIKPIAHMYKSQVYGLARHFGLPDEICNAKPTTDTYSLVQGQDEFYFALPYQQMDVAMRMLNRGEPPERLAEALDTDVSSAVKIYEDIRRKRKTTAYLHLPPLVPPACAVNPGPSPEAAAGGARHAFGA